jgi:glycine hydroxymethyltransferase
MSQDLLAEFAQRGIDLLRRGDPALYDLLYQEHQRQNETLAMVAASSVADPSVLACEGMATANVTAEGYPGARFHAGCRCIDGIEHLAIDRAKRAFGAQYANVQPHSGTSANEIVLFAVLQPGDTVLGLGLNSGGHLTHGARASVSGQYFNAIEYGLDQDGHIDYEHIECLAQEFRPKLIISGASAYPRQIDFQRFRTIADKVGAFLLADISHIAGLVVAGEHPSPIDWAHFTTTSTYKQLYGPRGGIILIGKDYEQPAPDRKRTLADLIQRAVFPFFQGTPNLSAIAAKARSLAIVTSPQFKVLAGQIVANAKTLAHCLVEKGYHVLTGGTDNHLVLVDMLASGLTGVIAERALEECGILVNRNRIPGDTKSALVTSGVRFGTNSLAARGMGAPEIRRCVDLIETILSSVAVRSDEAYELDPTRKTAALREVRQLCAAFPIPDYLPGA